MNTQTFDPKDAVHQHYITIGGCLTRLKKIKINPEYKTAHPDYNETLDKNIISLNLREVARLRKKYPDIFSRTRTRQTRLKI